MDFAHSPCSKLSECPDPTILLFRRRPRGCAAVASSPRVFEIDEATNHSDSEAFLHAGPPHARTPPGLSLPNFKPYNLTLEHLDHMGGGPMSRLI